MTGYLDSGNDSIDLDGTANRVLDFGGRDSYVLRPESLRGLTGDVTLVDNQASDIYFAAGLAISEASFAADGVRFGIQGQQVTFLGQPASFTFIFGGTPGQTQGSTALNFAQTAEAFGARVPALGEEPSMASKTGVIQADGTLKPVEILSVTAANTNPTEASDGDFYFEIHPGLYTYSIAGFGTGDYLSFPAGNTPTLVNADFNDGEVRLVWTSAEAEGPVSIQLTGLATSDDAQLLQLSDFTALFGAGAVL
jgi:hypothetical protein